MKSQMGFGRWLLLLFIALKLTDQIDWPWYYVLSPLMVILVVGAINGLHKRKYK